MVKVPCSFYTQAGASHFAIVERKQGITLLDKPGHDRGGNDPHRPRQWFMSEFWFCGITTLRLAHALAGTSSSANQ